jgi:hypothetical protein
MSIEIWFAIFAFAVYRLAELVTNDTILDGFRRWFVKRAAAGGAVWKFLAKLVNCPLCIGVWFALPAAYLYDKYIFQTGNIFLRIILWLGLAGIQYLLSVQRLNNDVD